MSLKIVYPQANRCRPSLCLNVSFAVNTETQRERYGSEAGSRTATCGLCAGRRIAEKPLISGFSILFPAGLLQFLAMTKAHRGQDVWSQLVTFEAGFETMLLKEEKFMIALMLQALTHHGSVCGQICKGRWHNIADFLSFVYCISISSSYPSISYTILSLGGRRGVWCLSSAVIGWQAKYTLGNLSQGDIETHRTNSHTHPDHREINSP